MLSSTLSLTVLLSLATTLFALPSPRPAGGDVPIGTGLGAAGLSVSQLLATLFTTVPPIPSILRDG